MTIVRWDGRDHPVDLWSNGGPMERGRTFSKDGTVGSNEVHEHFFADQEHFAAAVPRDGRILVPAVAAALRGSQRIYSMGCMEVDLNHRLTELQPGEDVWLEAYVRLTGWTYWPIVQGPEPARPKIVFNLAGGSADRRGFRRPDPYFLEHAILRLWARWQSEEFKKYQVDNHFDLWGARHQSLLEIGFKEPISMSRLKKAYYDLFPVPKGRKLKKLSSRTVEIRD